LTNLSHNLTESAEMYAERPALRMGDTTLTYAAFDEAASRLASLVVSLGMEPGDRVGVMLPNITAFPIIFYGVLRAGGVVVPMNPLLKHAEVEYYLEDSGAKMIFAWDAVMSEAAQAAAEAGATLVAVGPDFPTELAAHAPVEGDLGRDDEETAVILYTSGTTGKPKGAELTHANLNRNQAVTVSTLINLTPDDVVMGCLPLFHVFGLTCGLNASVASGSLLTLLPRFDGKQALEIVQRDRVTVFEGVPTMYSALLAVPEGTAYDTSTMRTCVSGGAALPVEVLRNFEEAFDVMVLEGYGLSETSPVASFNHPDKERKPGSIGTPIAGVQMRAVDLDGNEVAPGEVGEIQIMGHNVMKSYWRRPQATAEAIRNGWFSTGDLARVDDDGYFFIVDRKKDLIIRGGYNVYPREVEEVLYQHPLVAEVAVIGIPHATLGEEIGAAVSLKPGAEAAPEELVAFAKERIAAYKYPRLVWVLDGLPKGPTGKILRREVHPPQATPATTGPS
jgi:long-chain acyl-CoA synthetase